jgi:hypothetical protein
MHSVSGRSGRIVDTSGCRAMIGAMAAATRPESRRYDFPPLWAVPVLLIAAIGVIFYVSLTFGVLGFIGGLLLIAWLQRKADTFVRGRDTAE